MAVHPVVNRDVGQRDGIQDLASLASRVIRIRRPDTLCRRNSQKNFGIGPGSSAWGSSGLLAVHLPVVTRGGRLGRCATIDLLAEAGREQRRGSGARDRPCGHGQRAEARRAAGLRADKVRPVS